MTSLVPGGNYTMLLREGLSPLYVVTVVFNPRRFRSRYRLYRDFERWCRNHGVSLVTVEIAFGNRPWAITAAGNPWHVRLRSPHELWHKERGLNLGLRRLAQLVPNWEYVAWMDADVKLARDDWAEETVHLLQHYAVLQLFGEARSLDRDCHLLFSCRSIMRNYEDYGVIDWGDNPGLRTDRPLDRAQREEQERQLRYDREQQERLARKGHPGLGWAFRRHELELVGGWLDVCINGSGDLHMAGCFTGQPDLALPAGVSSGYRDAITRYGERCEKYVGRNASFVPGGCDHYFHGHSKDRGYDDRWRLLVRHQFDPVTDLVVDTQGLFRWAGNKRGLEYDTRKSLRRRNEDAV